LIRKMIQASSSQKTFEKIDASTFSATDKSTKATLIWKFQLGQAFESKGFDRKMHRITFEIKDDQLYETHVRLEGGHDQDEIYRYERDGDYLILHLENGSVHAKRYFKKQIN